MRIDCVVSKSSFVFVFWEQAFERVIFRDTNLGTKGFIHYRIMRKLGETGTYLPGHLYY